jgi:hypothetical protein
MTPAKGPRKMLYAFMKLRKPSADARMSHGQSAQPPTSAQSTCPRRMSTKRGKRTAMSFPAESELAETFVPSVASANASAAKKDAARLSHRCVRL